MTSSPPKFTPLIVKRSDDINVAQEAWLWLKVNLAYLTGTVAVLVIGVILARLLSKWATSR